MLPPTPSHYIAANGAPATVSALSHFGEEDGLS